MSEKKAYDRERYLRNKEAVKARAAEWARANPERRREIVKKNNEKRALERRDWHQRKVFGLAIERTHCEMCGTTEGGKKGLVIHHKDGCNGKQGTSLNNDPGNLVVLCRACHVRVHSRWGLKVVVPS